MAWYNKIVGGKSPTNPDVQEMLQSLPGTSLTTPQTGPQPITAYQYTNGFVNMARYARALRVGGSWWDLLDIYHSSTGYSIYDFPE